MGTGVRWGWIPVWTLPFSSWLKHCVWEPHVAGPFIPLYGSLATEEMGGLEKQSLETAHIVQISGNLKLNLVAKKMK